MNQENTNESLKTEQLLWQLTRDGYIKEVLKSENIKSIVFLDEKDFNKHGIDAGPKEIASSINRSIIGLGLPLKAETCNESKKYITFKMPEGMMLDSLIILRRTKKFDLRNYDLLDRRNKLSEAYKNLLRQEYIKNLFPNIKFDKKIPHYISPIEERTLIIDENMEKMNEEQKQKKREEERKYFKEMKGTRGS